MGACLLTTIGLYILKKKSLADWYGNAIFIWLLTWKFTVLLFQFPLILAQPLTILYFDGGIKGYWLGLFVTGLYALYKIKYQSLRVSDIYQTWICSMIFYEILYAILNYGSFLWTGIQMFIGILFLVFVSKKNQFIWKEQLLILYTGVQAILYSVHDTLLSIPMVTYLLMAIFLVSAMRKWEVSE